MLKNTIAVIDSIITDIKNLLLNVRHGFHLILIIPPLYSVLSAKMLWTNLPLLLISISHYIFFIRTYGKRDKDTKKAVKDEKKLYLIIRNVIKVVALISSIIAIYSAINQPDIIMIASAVITIISLVFTLILELISKFIESRKEMLLDAIKMDFEAVTNPLTSAVDKVTYLLNPHRDISEDKHKTKHRDKIVMLAAKHQEKAEKKKEEKRLAKEARKTEKAKPKIPIHK